MAGSIYNIIYGKNKKEYGSKKNDVVYPLQDFMSCSLPKDCSFWGSGLFKIGKEYYRRIEVCVCTIPPPPPPPNE